MSGAPSCVWWEASRGTLPGQSACATGEAQLPVSPRGAEAISSVLIPAEGGNLFLASEVLAKRWQVHLVSQDSLFPLLNPTPPGRASISAGGP